MNGQRIRPASRFRASQRKKTMKQKILQTVFAVLLCAGANAQVNTGSNGSDGAFNPATNTVINMADHPDGIYQYTSVNIPSGVTVTFIPNAANTPVVWLVQGSVTNSGVINLLGSDGVNSGTGGVGGPGGFRGGNPGGGGSTPGEGAGPGGGMAGSLKAIGGNASYGTLGVVNANVQADPGEIYGNTFLVPLIGGSGGGGNNGASGGGGGGAILIAANDTILLDGTINAQGGSGGYGIGNYTAGGGSGGAVRLVGTRIRGGGAMLVNGGYAVYPYYGTIIAGTGRIRFDSLDNTFTGYTSGTTNRGYQPIIIPPPNQAVGLAIQSVGGVAVVANPTGASLTPDVIVPGQQANPVSIVVHCVNIPLNTDIIVDVKPANGSTVRVVGANNTGTQASSTATVSVTMPRGAGTIQAKAVSGIAGSLGASLNNGEKFRHYAQTGLTADGELFAKMEITATLGQGQEIAYITESGKRFVMPHN
jgi:hypothetical protein